jgi:hypothetical protein
MTYIFDKKLGKVVRLHRDTANRDNRFITGAKDETSPDVAVPKAFRQLEEKHSAREIARQAGWSVDTIRRTWQMVIAFLFIVLTCNGADLTRGISFVDGQRIYAAQLQTLVDNATINTAFITGKTEQTALGASDYFVLYSASGAALRKISGNNLLLNNTNWVTNLTENFILTTNSYFPFYDIPNAQLRRVSLLSLMNPSNTSALYPTWTSNLNDTLQWRITDGVSNYAIPYAAIKTNLATNWAYWLWLGPTNATYPSNAPTLSTSAPVNADRFWISDSANTYSNKAVTWQTLKQAVTNTSIIAESRNLIMQATNATIQLLTCDDMILKATNGASYSTGAFALTNNLLLTTITNGVDTGSSGVSSNWYYIHVMSDGTNVATIASLSSNNPALPTPWIYRAMAGPAFYDSASHYYTNYQTGREVFLYRSNVFASTLTTSYATMNLTAISNALPPVALQVYGNAGTSTTTGGEISLAADNNGLGAVDIAMATGANTVNNMAGVSPFRLLIRTNQSFSAKSGSLNTSTLRIDITGYKF